jgi:hypothetical protein
MSGVPTIQRLDAVSWYLYARPFCELDADIRAELREEVEEGMYYLDPTTGTQLYDPTDNGNQGS